MDINDLVGKKIAVHCKTREEAEKFCQIASQNGYALIAIANKLKELE